MAASLTHESVPWRHDQDVDVRELEGISYAKVGSCDMIFFELAQDQEHPKPVWLLRQGCPI